MLAESIADWNSVYRSIDILWLDSQDYENWAKNEMQNINSVINRRGREISKELSKKKLCYYWLFQAGEDDNVPELKNCPICNTPFKKLETKLPQFVCEVCKIITAK